MQLQNHRAKLKWLILAISAFLAMRWAMLQLGSMLAGLAVSPSGQPVPIDQNFLLIAILTSFSFLFIAFVFTQYAYRSSLLKMGWNAPEYSHAIIGILSAIFILSTSALILIIMGEVKYNPGKSTTEAMLLQAISLLLLAVGEEAFFRGFVQRILQNLLSGKTALLITAGLFTLFHLANPSVSVWAAIGVFAGGLLLGINYLYTGNLWFGILFHWIWNCFQGPVLGIAVSGIETPSFLHPTLQPGSIWTGGNFGMEASPIVIFLLLAMLPLLARKFSAEKRQIITRS